MERRKSRKIVAGGVEIGGGAPITVQSMTSTLTADVEATAAQIARLEAAGCEIVRVAVPDMPAAEAIAELKKRTKLPLVADIHFDYRLALAAAKAGIDKIRINPGNIGSPERVRAVADACRERGIPIRIGVNGGSVHKDIIKKYGGVTADALAESAISHVELLEDCGFYDIAISVKAAETALTVEAYRRLATMRDYPLHVGLTHSGTERIGVLKSAAAIGSLMMDGIGDTIRISLTADPVREVEVGLDLLRALDLRRGEPEVIACPTCGRCRIDLIALANEVERRLVGVKLPIKVAVMGCAVNGPGEARECDVGIAGGVGEGLVFRKGEIIKKVPQEQLVDALFEQIEMLEHSK